MSAWNVTVPRWEWYPDSGPFIDGGDNGQYLNLSSGIDLWYTTFGKKTSKKTPVLILHGGQGQSNQMYHQANALAKTRQVILQEYVFLPLLKTTNIASQHPRSRTFTLYQVYKLPLRRFYA